MPTMNKNIIFHPKQTKEEKMFGTRLTASDAATEEPEDNYVIFWHGVKITNKDSASRIIRSEKTTTNLRVHPDHFLWVSRQIARKEPTWVRFKKWLLALFRLRR